MGRFITGYIAAILTLIIVGCFVMGPVDEIPAASKTSTTEERTPPEKLETQEKGYEKLIERSFSEHTNIRVQDTPIRVDDIAAYEYRQYDHKTDELVLYLKSGIIIITQITDVRFW